MDGPCAACGSKDTSGLADAFGCQVCGAATSYDGRLVHGRTDGQPTAAAAPTPVKAKKKKG